MNIKRETIDTEECKMGKAEKQVGVGRLSVGNNVTYLSDGYTRSPIPTITPSTHVTNMHMYPVNLK